MLETCVHTVGIGKCPALGGTTLAALEDELRRVRDRYGAPDSAKMCRTAPGSIYFAEVIWIGPQ